MNQVTLTSNAALYIKRHLKAKPELLGVRIGVKPAGCSGLSYIMDFAKEIRSTDLLFESEGVKIAVDAKSLPYLKGTEIDWVEEGLNAYPKFNNPNVKSACGCGESFNIEK
jgi:iron-sulfur cluster assembly protein